MQTIAFPTLEDHDVLRFQRDRLIAKHGSSGERAWVGYLMRADSEIETLTLAIDNLKRARTKLLNADYLLSDADYQRLERWREAIKRMEQDLEEDLA